MRYFNIRTSEPDINICVIAAVLDEICHQISRQPVRTAVPEYPYLRGLKLADCHQDDTAIKIDILLGADHYYEFVTNDIRCEIETRLASFPSNGR